MHAMTGPPDAVASADNELLTQILARRKRRLPRLTMALAALLVVALTFVVGAEVQKHYGKTAAATSGAGAAAAAFGRARGAGGFPGGFGGAGGTGGAGAAGGFGAAASGTTGTVTLIKGSTLYVTDSSGTTSLVKTSATSRVTKTVTSSVKNIKPGSVVTVVGTQAKDGSYTATSISVANGG
jgi:hypothetical protein